MTKAELLRQMIELSYKAETYEGEVLIEMLEAMLEKEEEKHVVE